jgi:hypothetical protein
MSSRTTAYRGTVIPADDPAMLPWRNLLHTLADRFPVGARVQHTSGRAGTVARDHAAHVPGAHLGEATAVCLSGDLATTQAVARVFVSWDNEVDLPWRVWVPATAVSMVGTLTRNRPGNTATVENSR